MKKMLAVLALAVLAIASTARATVSRVSGMGLGLEGTFGGTNWAVVDETNIWDLPTALEGSGDHVYAEWGPSITGVGAANALDPSILNFTNPAAAWGGINYGFGDDNSMMGKQVIGIWYGRPYFVNPGLKNLFPITGGNPTGDPLADVAITNDNGNVAVFPAAYQFGAGGNPALAALTVPQNKLDLFYTFQLSFADFGVHLNLNSSGGDNTIQNVSNPVAAGDAKSESKVSNGGFGIGLGAMLENMLFMDSIELGFSYDSLGVDEDLNIVRYINGGTTATGTTANDELKTSGGSDIRVDARLTKAFTKGFKGIGYLAFHTWNDNYNFLHQLDGVVFDGNFTGAGDTNNNETGTNTGSNWIVGLSTSMVPSENNLVILGADLNGSGTTLGRVNQNVNTGINIGTGSNNTTSLLAIPVFAALETKIANPLTGRMGFSKNIINNTVATNNTYTYNGANAVVATNTTTVNTNNTDPVTISAGLSFNVGSITLDGVLNQDVLFTGGYLISGVPASLNTRVSGSFKF